MSKRDPDLALQQILVHAQEAVSIAEGKTRTDLDSDRLLNLALTRLVEIIGEAANRISENVRSKYPQIPWQQMIGARNRLIHGYDNVDFDILWTIIQTDLPDLVVQLRKILEEK